MVPSSHSKRNVTNHDINTLTSLLQKTKAKILTPSSDGYSTSTKRWSRAAEMLAGVAIVPSSAEEISIVLKYAVAQNIDIAVKGGGHSTAGASSTDGGLLIDLGGMRNVRVDPENKLIYAQGGCLWGDVDDEAGKYGLATVGGTAADTGVGGLTLGGGYGVLSSQYGLVIDNLEEVTVVLANGDIKKASNKENKDLFWALAGAGQNFGVSVEFVYKAFEQEAMWIGWLMYPPTRENIRKLVDANNEMYTVHDGSGGKTTKCGGRAMSLMGFMKPPGSDQTLLGAATAFNGTGKEGKDLFKAWYDIGPVVDTMTTLPYPAVNKLFAPPIGMRVSMKGAATVLPIRAEFVEEMLKKYEAFEPQIQDETQAMLMWELFDTVKVAESKAGSFANRGYHLNVLIAPFWTNPANDESCRQWAREASEMFKIELEYQGKETGEGVDGGVGIRGDKGAVLLYGNYDQYDEKSRDIFGTNYSRLQQLKAEYDPTNAFNKLFAISPSSQ